MYYTIYQITNNLDGKIYIGKHQKNKSRMADFQRTGIAAACRDKAKTKRAATRAATRFQ